MTGEPPLPGVGELYDAAPCGHLLADASGRLLHANTTLCRWLQYDRATLLGKKLQDLMTTGGRIFFHTHLQPLLRMQGSVSEVKLELRRQDGAVLPMILNVIERGYEGVTLWQVAAFIAEDRHKYERELVLQRQRAEELARQHAEDQQALGAARAEAEDRAVFAEQLVGMVSHDIRNPLSVIHMSTTLLQRGVSPEQHQAVVARVARAVDRVQHLIGDLLDFTQARLGGGLRASLEAVDLHGAVAEAVAELGLAFPQRTLLHEQEGAGSVRADSHRIAQAIGNLVANAVNHGAPDGVITVRTRSLPGQFTIEVHNHGKPIPPEAMPTLFEPLVRGQAAVSQGVGLGLYIVRAIAAAHGGTVEARSAAGEGTTFTIRFPAG